MKKTKKTSAAKHSIVTNEIVHELQLSEADAARVESAYAELGMSRGSFNATVTTYTVEGRIEKDVHGIFEGNVANTTSRNSRIFLFVNDWSEVTEGARVLTHVAFHSP